MSNTKFDYIIVGAGCAGLSLAYRLLKSSLHSKKVLLIDKTQKNTNDRTWCFWETGKDIFEPIVSNSWSKAEISGKDFTEIFDILPYEYKMIRSKDFYELVFSELEEIENFQVIYGDALIQIKNNHASVLLNGERYEAEWIFNSVQPADLKNEITTTNFLLQHFRGWFISTEEGTFNTDEIKLMDFNTQQNKNTRFFYVLPVSGSEALVEYTVFSPEILQQEEYKSKLQQYINDNLGINKFEIIHDEFGVIPMTDHRFEEQPAENLINIGTAGGDTKASTGYTFRRIQERTLSIVSALEKNNSPVIVNSLNRKKYILYDSTVLNVLVNNSYPGDELFLRLFKRNGAYNVLKFLDEKTSLTEDLKIFKSTPGLIFMKALMQEILK